MMSANVKSVIIAYRDFDNFNIFKKNLSIFEHLTTKNQYIYDFEININDNRTKYRRAIYVILIPRTSDFPIYKHISVFEFNPIMKVSTISKHSIVTTLFDSMIPQLPTFIKSVQPKKMNQKEKIEYNKLLGTLVEQEYIVL